MFKTGVAPDWVATPWCLPLCPLPVAAWGFGLLLLQSDLWPLQLAEQRPSSGRWPVLSV